MPGIINWDGLWKAAHSRGFGRGGEDLASHWDRKAREFNRRVMRNTERSRLQVASMELLPHETVLDIGAGTGRLAIPMAKAAKKVTAIDQSGGMLSCLRENMQAQGVTNIECIQKRWQDVGPGDLPVHDVVISSNSLGVYDLREALAKMDSLAIRAVYIFTFADHRRDDGFREFMMTDHRRRPEGFPPDYLVICNLLADMGIYADVEIKRSESDERYTGIEEAVLSWKEIFDVPDEMVPKLREFLSGRLVPDGDGVRMHRSSNQARISWRKAGV